MTLCRVKLSEEHNISIANSNDSSMDTNTQIHPNTNNLNPTSISKRKISVNSQGSNKASSNRKKNVIFKISSNQFNGIINLIFFRV